MTTTDGVYFSVKDLEDACTRNVVKNHRDAADKLVTQCWPCVMTHDNLVHVHGGRGVSKSVLWGSKQITWNLHSTLQMYLINWLFFVVFTTYLSKYQRNIISFFDHCTFRFQKKMVSLEWIVPDRSFSLPYVIRWVDTRFIVQIKKKIIIIQLIFTLSSKVLRALPMMHTDLI